MASPATTMKVFGGKYALKYRARTSAIFARYATLVVYVVSFTTSSSEAPAEASTALRFSNTWTACASISPLPTMVPSMSCATCPAV